MIQQRQIGSLTEIYVNGGGYLTQSFPTYFHNFYTRKVLTAKEHIEDYKEVTEAEKTKIEAEDAKWERPQQSFIELWNAACNYRDGAWGCKPHGQYNEETGYFELNGLTDLTYHEAKQIYVLGAPTPDDSKMKFWNNQKCRTFLPFNSWREYAHIQFTYASCAALEVVNAYNCIPMDRSFAWSQKLKRIFGLYAINGSINNNEIYKMCTSLEEIEFSIVYSDINVELNDSPKISFATLDRIVAKTGVSTKPMTVTLHPEAYARLTEELIAKATDKNITFITT